MEVPVIKDNNVINPQKVLLESNINNTIVKRNNPNVNVKQKSNNDIFKRFKYK